MTRLIALYPQANATGATIAAYASELMDLPDFTVLERVVKDLIRYEERLPSVARIRQAYVDHRLTNLNALPAAEPECDHGVRGFCEQCREVGLKHIRRMIADLEEANDAGL